MNKMNKLTAIGLLIFAIFMVVNYTVHKFGKIPTIVILVIACIFILAGAFRHQAH